MEACGAYEEIMGCTLLVERFSLLQRTRSSGKIFFILEKNIYIHICYTNIHNYIFDLFFKKKSAFIAGDKLK